MNIRRKTAPAGLAALGLLLAGCGHNTTAMAPPTSMMQPPAAIQPVSTPGGGQTTALSPSQYTPYNWTSVPQNQQIPIVRATFDRGGYQLYDTSGDDIVVPFTDQNLYVMRFGQSSNGQMYFVNTGTAPVLYVPTGGYLENASVQGAHWYPFSQNFAYTGQPVYVGPAPDWAAFTGMGWYPGMMYYGGYYGYHPWGFGSPFLPMVGLSFLIGGHPYYGWNSYHTYYNSHPGYVRTTYNPNVYHTASLGRTGSFGGGRTFGRTGPVSGGRAGSFSSGTRPFGTATGSFSGSRPFGSAPTRPSGSFGAAPRAFGGGTRTSTGSFGGGAAGYGGSFGRTGGFNSRPFGGGAPAARPSFGGGTFGSRPSFGGGSSGSRPSFGGGRSFGGGSFGGGGRSFGGGFGGRRR